MRTFTTKIGTIEATEQYDSYNDEYYTELWSVEQERYIGELPIREDSKFLEFEIKEFIDEIEAAE